MKFRPPHIVIIQSRFYPEIADELLRGATIALDGVDATYECCNVPGVFEIPAAIKFFLDSKGCNSQYRQVDGYIALGCVIRGETSHYEYVCGESARAIQDLAYQYALAMGYGVLTVENIKQAWERSGIDRRDKGGGAARTCLEMIKLKNKLGLGTE